MVAYVTRHDEEKGEHKVASSSYSERQNRSTKTVAIAICSERSTSSGNSSCEHIRGDAPRMFSAIITESRIAVPLFVAGNRVSLNRPETRPHGPRSDFKNDLSTCLLVQASL